MCILYVNIFIIVAVKSRISDKRRCVDAKCSVLISTAVAQLTYHSDDPRILSFPARAKIEVYSYEAGEREDLWGIQYNGKRGYGPKAMLRENKMFVSSKDVNVIVPTEINSEFNILDSKVNVEKNVISSGSARGMFGIIGASAEPDIKPNKVRVVEGTTLMYNMESGPDDENISDGVEKLVTPPVEMDGLPGLPLPFPEQVPESTTTPSVEPSKSDKTAGDLQSESVIESVDSVQSTANGTDTSSSGGETKESHDSGMSERNVSAHEEGDYADYEEEEEEEEEDEEIEEAEVEDESDETNVTVTTEETEQVSVAESVSASDVKSENVTEKGVEQQQNVHDAAESIQATGSLDTKEEPSQVQNESVVESVTTEHPVTLVSVESKQEDVVVVQTPETVKQSEIQLDSPLAEVQHEVHSDVDTSNDIGSENISSEPQVMVTQGETNINEKKEEEFGEVKSDQVSESIDSRSDTVQEETTKTEENQNIEEKPATEHIDHMLEQDSMQTVKPDPAVNERNMSEDTGKVAVNSESSAESGSHQQQSASTKGHSDGNVDVEKANTEDMLPAVSSENNETENIVESESVTDVPEEASTEQSVGIDSKDDSGMFSTVKQEDVAIRDAVRSEEPEKVYESRDDLTGDGLPSPSFPVKLSENTASEEPAVSEEPSSEAVSEDFTASIMAWFSSSVKTLQNYFQLSTSYSDIPKTGEEPSNTVSSIQESIVESSENWDQSKSDSLTDKACVIQNLGDEDSCEKITKLPPPRVWTQSDSASEGYEVFRTVIDLEKLPFETILWLLITAGTILTFTLGHYYIEAHRRDGLLVARINKLERELLVLRKESSLLEDQLLKAQDEIQAVDSSSSEAEALIASLKMELEESKIIRMDLEDQVTSLEKELESVTESGLEMHMLLSESLSNQDGSQVLLKTVENLREKLNAQDAEISLLNQSIVEKNEEIESLKNDLLHSQDMYKHVEERLNILQREKEEEALELKDKHRALSAQLEEVIESKALDETRTSTEISKLKLNIEEVQRNFAEKEAELETMRDAVKQLQSAEKNLNIDALYDVVSISAKLKATEKEKDEYREKFLEEEGARKLLEDHVRVISREVASLKENFEAAEKEKIDALTKLQVLSNYFKEKESQLQKELGLQESMWLQKQSDDHTIYEQMKSLREENEKYKLQNESLKKEICEQESSFKIQIANIEQRAHENWVACRQSERRLKEVQQEASQLRNRLTLSEKNAANHTLDDSKPKISESNGDPSSPPPSLIFPATTSPPFMMYPGLPGEFIPPPPLVSAPPFSPDSRPPPLGRISSPQLDPRFSPPPPLPYSPYDFQYGGHHSPSPPPPLPQHRTVHKPQPRENAREQKDSSSKNYNASETADKPSRRNKR